MGSKDHQETTWIFMEVLSSITLDQSQLEWSSTNTTNNKLLFRPLKACDRMNEWTRTLSPTIYIYISRNSSSSSSNSRCVYIAPIRQWLFMNSALLQKAINKKKPPALYCGFSLFVWILRLRHVSLSRWLGLAWLSHADYTYYPQLVCVTIQSYVVQ